MTKLGLKGNIFSTISKILNVKPDIGTIEHIEKSSDSSDSYVFTSLSEKSPIEGEKPELAIEKQERSETKSTEEKHTEVKQKEPEQVQEKTEKQSAKTTESSQIEKGEPSESKEHSKTLSKHTEQGEHVKEHLSEIESTKHVQKTEEGQKETSSKHESKESQPEELTEYQKQITENPLVKSKEPTFLVNKKVLESKIQKFQIPISSETKSLDLSYLYLDSIPSELYKETPNLEELNLEGNTEIEIDENFKTIGKNLKVLNLRNCDISKASFALLCDCLENIEYLDISGNKRIKINQDFGLTFKKIKVLNVGQCNLTFCDLSRMHFEGLVELVLDGNDMYDIPETYGFGNFHLHDEPLTCSLQKLHAVGCSLTHKGLQALTNTCLKYLNVSLNSFHVTDKTSQIGQMKTLAKSWLPSGLSYKAIGNWTKKVKQNWITGVQRGKNALVVLKFYGEVHPSWFNDSNIEPDFNLKNLANSLETLILNYCLIGRLQLETIVKQTTKLKILEVNGNELHDLDKSFSFHGAEGTLEELHMQGCALIPECLCSLQNLKKLCVLSLGGNDFSDMQCSNWKLKFDKVVDLSLEWTGITEKDLNFISNIMPSVEKLSIKSNRFSDALNLNHKWYRTVKILNMDDCVMNETVFLHFMQFVNLTELQAVVNFDILYYLTKNKNLKEYVKKTLKKLKLGNVSMVKHPKGIDLTDFSLTVLEIQHFDSQVKLQEESEKESKGSVALIKLPKTLQRLSFSHMLLTKEQIEHIADLSELQQLTLQNIYLINNESVQFKFDSFKKLEYFFGHFIKEIRSELDITEYALKTLNNAFLVFYVNRI